MSILNILVANNQLHMVGGSETFTYTLLEEIKSQGHNVEYFTLKKGVVSDRIEKNLGITFMSESRYDLILANHNTCVDALYKKGFTIQTCHGIFPKLEQPSRNANAFVAISEEVQNHLALLDIPSLLIHNSINIERFRPIRPVSSKLETVLSLCHSEEANQFVEEACKELDIKFIKAYKYENAVWDIENLINQADLVVGLGRSAYEGMACGRPVIVYDNRKYFESCGDGYIKSNLGLSLKNNCSGRYSKIQFDKKMFIQELLKYNPSDGLYFREFVKRELDVSKNLLKYIAFSNNLQKKRKLRRKETNLKRIHKLIGSKGIKVCTKVINAIR